MSKPRGKIETTLTQDQYEEFFQMLKGGMTYSAGRIYLRKEYDLKTSLAALHDFFERQDRLDREARRLKTCAAVQHLNNQAAELLPGLDSATEIALKQRAFDAIDSGDAELADDYFSMVMKLAKQRFDTEKLEQSERRIVLLEKKAAMLDQVEDVAAKSTLTLEEKDAKYRKIFGLPSKHDA